MLKIFFKLTFAVGIVVYLVLNGYIDFGKLVALSNEPFLLPVIFLTTAFLVPSLLSLRLYVFLRSSYTLVPFFHTFLLTWIGNFFNVTLPGAVSGDVIKGYYMHKLLPTSTNLKIINILFLDRIVGLFGLVILSLFGIMLRLAIDEDYWLSTFEYSISGMFVGIGLFYVSLVLPYSPERHPIIYLLKKLPKSGFLIRFYESFLTMRTQKMTFLLTLTLSLAMHVVNLVILSHLAELIMEPAPSITQHAMVAPIGFIATSIPIFPAGIGIGHVGFEGLYVLLGFAGGANLFNFFVIIQITAHLLGGFAYVLVKAETKKG